MEGCRETANPFVRYIQVLSEKTPALLRCTVGAAYHTFVVLLNSSVSFCPKLIRDGHELIVFQHISQERREGDAGEALVGEVGS